MLGLSADRLQADMNRLLTLLFHQVIFFPLTFYSYTRLFSLPSFSWSQSPTSWQPIPSKKILLNDLCCLQGVLDEQFLQLQELQDESSPNFVSEVVNLYFRESDKHLRNLRAILWVLFVCFKLMIEMILINMRFTLLFFCSGGFLSMDREYLDYKKLGIHLNHFMGSSSSIGAKRVRNVCLAFRAASEQNSRVGYVSEFRNITLVWEKEREKSTTKTCCWPEKVRRLFRPCIFLLTRFV